MYSVLNTIIQDDVLKGLKKIPDNSVHLIFTSPPYNTDIKYGNHEDSMSWGDYLKWLKDIWIECNRVLVSGGRLAVNIDAITNWDEDRDKEYVRPIYGELINQMKDIDGLNFRTEIAWFKHQVVGRATAWGSYASCSNPVVRRNHEYVLVWSKGQWKLEGDPELSDMTDEEFQQWTMSFWHVTPETVRKGAHPAPFPEELAKRVIKLFSYRHNTVLDIFSGSGTVAKVAVNLHRNYIGIDNDEKYVKDSRKRIAEAEAARKNEALMGYEYVPRSKRLQDIKKAKQKQEQSETDIFS